MFIRKEQPIVRRKTLITTGFGVFIIAIFLFVFLPVAESSQQPAATTLYIPQMLDAYILEFGTVKDFTPADFITNKSIIPPELIEATIITPLPPSQKLTTGWYTVVILINGERYYSAVHVVDTTPPTVTTKKITREMGNPIDPTDVIITMVDYSPITLIEWEIAPDYFTPGEQEVSVRVMDAYENYTLATVQITFLPNTVPPVFYGVQDVYVSRGTPILFRDGVQAVDAFGREIAFTVDNTQVNIHERGIYPAMYIATDAWGLSTETEINVHVLSVNPETVYQYADEILARIINDDMTQVQQAHIIYHWIQNNISFAGGGVAYYAWHEAAHQGLIQRQGNCFVFAAMLDVMLTQAGIPSLPMIRTRYFTGRTRHRWVIFNPDELGWFHIDVTPNLHLTREQRFMFTQGEADEFTAFIRSTYGVREFYVFDDDLHPHITINP